MFSELPFLAPSPELIKIPQLGLRPQKGDVGDRAERWRATILIGVATMVLEGFLFATGKLPLAAKPLVYAISLPLVYFAGHAVAYLSERSARGFFNTLFSAGGESHTHEYSAQEALLIQGRIDECITSFHSYIAHHPEDLDARIRLAEVLGKEANDPAASEEMFLEVRIVGANARQDVSVSNGLIDLYRRAGKTEQLKAELARFARSHPGTLEARNAKAYLRQLAEHDA